VNDWLRYVVRVVACALMGLFGLVLLILAATVRESSRWMVAAFGVTCIVGAWLSWPRRPNAWRGDPPTVRQIAYAESLGIEIPFGATKGEVSDMISRVTGR
jgi:hypothetical protein